MRVCPTHLHFTSRADMRVVVNTLADPPEGEWVVSVAESGQKHSLPYAVVNRGRARWRVRMDALDVDATPEDFRHVFAHVCALRARGFSAEDIEHLRMPIGRIKTGHDLAVWQHHAEALAPWRSSSLIGVLARRPRASAVGRKSSISLFSYRIRSTWMSTSTATLRLDLSSLPLPLQQAVRFQSAMLDSANMDLIGLAAWWDRAQTALETGAATGTRFSEVVSATARKLQITWALSKETSAEIGRLTTELSDPAAFAEWRELCQRDAVYVTALTRIHRQARRKAAR